jgi:ribosomal protein L16 Arg81 hydroxylase
MQSMPPLQSQQTAWVDGSAHEAALDRLRQALQSLGEGSLSVTAFAAAWRSEEALLQVLPPGFTRLRDDLLQRLESGSLFDEESCSFSREDLCAALGVWLERAAQRLPMA